MRTTRAAHIKKARTTTTTTSREKPFFVRVTAAVHASRVVPCLFFPCRERRRPAIINAGPLPLASPPPATLQLRTVPRGPRRPGYTVACVLYYNRGRVYVLLTIVITMHRPFDQSSPAAPLRAARTSRIRRKRTRARDDGTYVITPRVGTCVQSLCFKLTPRRRVVPASRYNNTRVDAAVSWRFGGQRTSRMNILCIFIIIIILICARVRDNTAVHARPFAF